ncbi:transcriptional regulator [Streptomyces carminius]|uniref:Transcriptional regulator n=1 Tax=Streptomyces carminius TaxID=2665496 RepID=A0A2M8LXM5_9ACTN|nr:transcriptional regulator [Streptomyces carminius]
MLSVASDLCCLTGYMAVDEGLQGLAQQCYLKALELAGAAEDHLTYCTTLRGMSVQAADLGHGPRALHLADAAARAGDRRGAPARLREAEVALDKAESHTGLTGRYDHAGLADHTSQVRYELGDIGGAVKAKVESNRLRQPTQRRSRVRNLMIAAERQMRLGHLEQAAATWNLALDEYPYVQSGRADARVRTVVSLIRPHLRNRAARELHDRARTAAPAAFRA